MDRSFDPSPEELRILDELAAQVPDIQDMLVERHPAIRQPDRAAHQHQVAGGVVRLEIAAELPAELDGIGVFRAGTATKGVGRISTGMGCPHLETDPDFLGLMLAFQTPEKQRVDFLAINDPAAPADDAEVFLDVLAASADAAGAEIPFGDAGELDLGNLTAAQGKMLEGLRKRLGLVRAVAVYLHLVKQTARTALSSTAVQPYWTGVVETGGRLGKFKFVPPEKAGHRALHPGERYLTDDWSERVAAGAISFGLWWIPYLSDDETPLTGLTKGWREDHAVLTGAVYFERADPDSRASRLVALLASEMGANPGNWVRGAHSRAGDLPSTRFGAARQRAYGVGQEHRGALPAAAYQSFFDGGGTIDGALAAELERRHDAKKASGHAGPSLAPDRPRRQRGVGGASPPDGERA